ncbi:MAG: T9SS type A sorting domain-containing protein [Bacteroidia bacterium]|nr:T9SS type A sorting domain-containing protein [Bacteroidia bacterium]
MKKILTLIILTTIFIKGFAQEIPLDIVDRINTVDYIFEGEVLNSQSYQLSTSHEIYTSNLIKISKIFKGDLECGTVELITTGGIINNILSRTSHTLQPERGDKGIFLCKANWRDAPPNNFWNATNNQLLGAYFEDQSFISYSIENNQIIAHDVLGSFDSLAQVYNLAQIITGFNYIVCNEELNFISKPNIPNPDLTETFIPYTKAQYDENRNWIEYQKEHYIRKKKKTRAGDTVSYYIFNPIVTGTATKYFEFDIKISDNIWTKYLDICYLRIKYPTNIFGTNIVASNNITITRGNLIADTNCYANPIPNDFMSDAFTVDITEKVYSQCKQQITAIPNGLIHVKMKMNNCIPNSPISFQDTVIFGGLSTYMSEPLYADFPNDTFSTAYDTFKVSPPVNIPNCVATITSFSPDTVRGGVGDTLTVRGFQFGPIQGNGNLYFTNSETPTNNSYIPLEPSDYLLWSDTLIKIIVPSIDTGANVDPIGSCKFIIQNNVGEKDTANQRLEILYSIYNYRKPTAEKVPEVFIKRQSDGYRFHVDTLIYQNDSAMWCIQKALYEWRCATGVNMYIEKDTFGLPKVPFFDSVNYIFYTNQGFRPAVTHSKFYIFNTNTIPLAEIDIEINKNIKPFHYDTLGAVPKGKADFYAIMLHEIGHAVQQNHVCDTQKIMYVYQQPDTAVIPYNKRKIFIMNDTSAFQGGRKSVNIPLDANAQALFNGMVILPICQGYTLINTVDKENNVTIYPNPFSNFITVKVPDNEKLLSVKLLNNNGQVVYSTANFGVGANKVNLPNHLTRGLYILVIGTDKSTTTKKVIHE